MAHVDTLAVAQFLAQDFTDGSLLGIFTAPTDELDESCVHQPGLGGAATIAGAMLHTKQTAGRLFASPARAISSSCKARDACTIGEAASSAGWSSQCTEVGTEFGCSSASTGNRSALMLTRRARSSIVVASVVVRFATADHVVDARFYRDAQLAVLVQSESGTRLYVLDCDTIPFRDVAKGSAATGARPLQTPTVAVRLTWQTTQRALSPSTWRMSTQ